MKPKVEWEQEVRFAVVMYGGVSLAIYINGVAQELLRLVRATAEDPSSKSKVANTLRATKGPEEGNAEESYALLATEDLEGSEAIYRELGQILGHGTPPGNQPPVKDAAIRTRFVVDVLSGTSAGGINGVFLAKALANNQDMRQLRDLWITEGDISRLLNDRRAGRHQTSPLPGELPASLLNSRRMYANLLEAFRGMDAKPAASPSPLVDELDLFVTTTDVRGEVIPLQLADKVVYELRHRNVFHFRYGGGVDETGLPRCNSFTAADNPLLAFAARCTSAFPFAFEPMTVEQAQEVLRLFPSTAESELTEQRLSAVLESPVSTRATGSSQGVASDHRVQALADGGYLDNKPFSYVLDAVADRRARLPVDRKLFYIEPAPEHPEMERQPETPPDALENAKAALVDVPRYEPIREDLQRVLGRNRLVERVGRIVQGLDEDFGRLEGIRPPLSTETYGEQDLSGMIKLFGLSYGGYHRLKVAKLTDEIAEAFTCAAGFDLNSDEFLAIRYLVQAWRDTHYRHFLNQKDETRAVDNRLSFNRFLQDYDLNYRIRRLQFLQSRLNLLSLGGKQAEELLKQAGSSLVEGENLKKAARKLYGSVNAVLSDLLRVREGLRARGQNNPLRRYTEKAGIGRHILKELLGQPTEEKRGAFARQLLGFDTQALPENWSEVNAKQAHEAFVEAAAYLAERIKEVSVETSERCKTELFEAEEGGSGSWKSVRRCLEYVYERFEEYDHVMYPILYASGAGEERDMVDVIRISPEDAVALGYKPDKLAGTALHHFGAFMDAGWRRNDILWGRLDGAERIITALLPVPTLAERRQDLIKRAHLAILKEELGGESREAAVRVIARVAMEDKGSAQERAARAALSRGHGAGGGSAVRSLLQGLAEDESLYQYFRDSYSVDRSLDRLTVGRVAPRAVQVVGKILERIAESKGIESKFVSWIAKIGRFFWAMVEVAVPDSIPRKLVRHLTGVLGLFLLVLVVAGLVLRGLGLGSELLKLSSMCLGTVAILAFLRWLVENYLRGGSALGRFFRLVLTVIGAAALYFTVTGFAGILGKAGFLEKMGWEPQRFTIDPRKLFGAIVVLAIAANVLAEVWSIIVRVCRSLGRQARAVFKVVGNVLVGGWAIIVKGSHGLGRLARWTGQIVRHLVRAAKDFKGWIAQRRRRGRTTPR
jgi:patatin-related protein